MWIIYEGIEHRTDFTSAKGSKYSAWLLTGTKKGYLDAEDEPYQKQIFDNATATVLDKNGETEMLLYEFFQGCTPGDTIDIKFKQDGKFKSIKSVENRNRSVLPEGTKMNQVQQANSNESTALTAAVMFVNTLVNNGHYAEKTSPEVLLDAISTYMLRLEALKAINPFEDTTKFDFNEE